MHDRHARERESSRKPRRRASQTKEAQKGTKKARTEQKEGATYPSKEGSMGSWRLVRNKESMVVARTRSPEMSVRHEEWVVCVFALGLSRETYEKFTSSLIEKSKERWGLAIHEHSGVVSPFELVRLEWGCGRNGPDKTE